MFCTFVSLVWCSVSSPGLGMGWWWSLPHILYFLFLVCGPWKWASCLEHHAEVFKSFFVFLGFRCVLFWYLFPVGRVIFSEKILLSVSVSTYGRIRWFRLDVFEHTSCMFLFLLMKRPPLCRLKMFPIVLSAFGILLTYILNSVSDVTLPWGRPADVVTLLNSWFWYFTWIFLLFMYCIMSFCRYIGLLIAARLWLSPSLQTVSYACSRSSVVKLMYFPVKKFSFAIQTIYHIFHFLESELLRYYYVFSFQVVL